MSISNKRKFKRTIKSRCHNFWSRRKSRLQSRLFNNQVCHLLKWLIKTYGVPTSVWKPTYKYIKFLEHMHLHKGLRTTISRIKEDRLRVLQYLSGNIQSCNGCTYDGLPKKLYGLIPYIRKKDKTTLRFILSLLYGLRRFHLPLRPELETVTSPSSAGYYEWILKYIPGFTKALVKRLGKKNKSGFKFNYPSWQEYHYTTKGSPSGGQALVNCLQDLVSLPKSLINSISTLGGEELCQNMALLCRHASELSDILDQPLGDGNTTFRKIVAIPDSEGKTRLIAIGDYWSQTCLKPLHDYLNIVLRSIPQDQTFNQGEGLSELPFSSDTTYYSFDLSAFTDRFPIKILIGLLNYNYGLDKALAWYDIINGYDFEYKDPKGNLNNIRYNVGNPMGFYTSWPLTTLCHHFILYVASQELGKSWKLAKYKLLGDDIIIFDTDLALKYKEIISLIGVDIQLQKSHIGNSLFEFAKRIFTPYGEISPYSIKAGISGSKSYFGFIELLISNINKGWIPRTSMLEAVLNFYFEGPRSIRSKDRKRVASKIEDLLLLTRGIKEYDLSFLNLIRKIQLSYDYSLLTCNMEYVAKAMFNSCIVRSFEQTASSFHTDVNMKLEKALLHFTSYEDERSMVVYSHPYSFIYGKYVEEMYLDAMRSAYETDTTGGGNWLSHQRVLVSSDVDIMFSRRNYKQLNRRSSTSILLDKVYEVCHELIYYP